MTREMETLRRELNAVAAQAQGIKDAANADERRILLREHLVRLREATASLRMMESRMHDALERGQIAVDHTARERHMFMFDQFSTMMTLMESALVDAQAPMVGCGSSEVAPKNGR